MKQKAESRKLDVLLVVQKGRRSLLDRLYEQIGLLTNCDIYEITKDEIANFCRYVYNNSIDFKKYDRIVLFSLRSKALFKQLYFVRSIQNLVIVEYDAWQNYYYNKGNFSRFYNKLPGVRVISSGWQVTQWLCAEGVEAYFVPKGCDTVALQNLHSERDIELAFVGSTKSDDYRDRRAMIEKISERESLLVTQTESGDEYCRLLNRIRFFISIDAGMNEYMIKNFEAMACGCVLCAYNQGEAENRAIGFVDMENVVLYCNVDELQAKLRILRSDPALADRIATSGQIMAERMYSYESIAARIVDALEPPLRPYTQPTRIEILKLILQQFYFF
jgi:glycosyltransferase involved in cell wall biosynthesis